jgi:hypothetical protein
MRCASLCRLILVALIVTVLDPPPSLAQSCQRKAEITSGADVFASPPKFITGRGWQGNREAYLTRGTQVYICAEQRIEFGLSTKIWAKIAYRNGGGFQFGWVLRENVADWHAWRHNDGSEPTSVLSRSPMPVIRPWEKGNSPNGNSVNLLKKPLLTPTATRLLLGIIEPPQL